jgi:hypothetical protein
MVASVRIESLAIHGKSGYALVDVGGGAFGCLRANRRRSTRSTDAERQSCTTCDVGGHTCIAGCA